MQIGGIGGGYASNMYQIQQQMSSGGQSASTSSAKASGGYFGMSDISALAQYARKAMDSMGVGANDKVTFGQISAYRSEKEKTFSEKLQKDLTEFGVDKDIKFQLSLDNEGGILVNTEHADKAKVEKYFKDNPEMASQYKEIQALNNLEAARKSMKTSPTELKKRIQVESMASWWADSGNESSSIGNYSAGSMAMYSGINTKI